MTGKKKPETERAERFLPFSIEQNPAPVNLEGQDAKDQIQNLADSIMATFRRVVPSNYVGQVDGPYYSQQYRALAKVLAEIQITASEAALDGYIDFTRPEFLWQTIGTLIFPTARDSDEAPVIFGDVSYRTFLKRMVALLLEGATLKVQEEGVGLLTDAVVTVLEKVAHQRKSYSAWQYPEQFEFEVNVSGTTVWTDPGTGEKIQGEVGTGFPEFPFITQRNVNIVLRALKPAHALFEYRHLFHESFQHLFEDAVSFDIHSYYYDDFRKFCTGRKEITGVDGETLTNRFLFSDPTREFRSVAPGAVLEILTGPNARPTLGGKSQATLGLYRVREILRMPGGAESTPRGYTTSPSNLAGTLIVQDNGELEDSDQDWSQAVEGEILTILSGPNAGRYRLETLLGPTGGPVGFIASGSGISRVRVAPSLLRVETLMPEATKSQVYRVGVERLGVRVPQIVTGEDVSAQFVP